ncbi:MAG: 30S ribosomal protein S9 [Verrucomicrobiota bacterium]|nr:30S ribosomal protein S9 [Verrucomicrobiota bacterium]
MSETSTLIRATGRRKTATARVRLIPEGTGKITVNNREFADYCYDEQQQKVVNLPFKTVDAENKFDLIVTVSGGGPIGQSVAISHALSRALQKHNPEWRIALKKAGLLTRDPRRRERGKPGQPGARKRFQFSKR